MQKLCLVMAFAALIQHGWTVRVGDEEKDHSQPKIAMKRNGQHAHNDHRIKGNSSSVSHLGTKLSTLAAPHASMVQKTESEKLGFLLIPVIFQKAGVVVHWAGAGAHAAWHATVAVFNVCKEEWLKDLIVDAVVDTATCLAARWKNGKDHYDEATEWGEVAHAAIEIAMLTTTLLSEGFDDALKEATCSKAWEYFFKFIGKEETMKMACCKGEDCNDPDPVEDQSDPDHFEWCDGQKILAPDGDSVEELLDATNSNNWFMRMFALDNSAVDGARNQVCANLCEQLKGELDDAGSCVNYPPAGR